MSSLEISINVFFNLWRSKFPVHALNLIQIHAVLITMHGGKCAHFDLINACTET